MSTAETAAQAVDHAAAQAAALGHTLAPWAPYGPSLVVARCVQCRRPAWAGRRETFGPAIEVRCTQRGAR